MQITLLQAVIIGLWTAFCYSGMLWGIFTNRALVLSFGVGVVCGDLKTALQCGAIAELAFMGFGVGAGGTVPPNGNHYGWCYTRKCIIIIYSFCSRNSILTNSYLYSSCRCTRKCKQRIEKTRLWKISFTL